MIRYESINYNDTIFLVLRKVRESHNPIVETWKVHLDADTVLRKDGWYYFCRKVTDIDWEEI
jgi:hypothetical protein